MIKLSDPGHSLSVRVLLASVVFVIGCGDNLHPTSDGPTADGPRAPDGPTSDASLVDGPDSDAPVADASGVDGAVSDAQGTDAAAADAPIADSAVPDASIADAPNADAPVVVTPDAGPDADTQPNVAFVTSTSYNGQLGGLAGADALCMSRAAAAGLGGTFVAWLSTSTVNARDRLGAARGWVRTDGQPFTDRVADLVAGRIFYPLRYDELGADTGADPITPVRAWTGTLADGNVAPSSPPTNYATCSDWTSLGGASHEGVPRSTTYTWTSTGGVGPGPTACAAMRRLYCFQIDHSAEVTIPASTSRLAFLSASLWFPGGGLAAADAHCAGEAAAAGLPGTPGTFKALLATSTASALSRFSVAGGWRRVDNVPWTGFAETPLNVTLAGVYEASDLANPLNRVWTGATQPGVPGTLASTCQDWTSSSTGDNGYLGIASYTGQDAFGAVTMLGGPCAGGASEFRLYCLEE